MLHLRYMVILYHHFVFQLTQLSERNNSNKSTGFIEQFMGFSSLKRMKPTGDILWIYVLLSRVVENFKMI